MGAPKSVVKIDSNGIQFTDSCDRTMYFMHELTRAALRDVAKLIRKKYKEAYYGQFRKKTGAGPKSISSVVFSSKGTTHPRVEIGIKHSNPGKPVKGFYTYFHELGTKHENPKPLLKSVVEANIADIRRIEAAYLSGIETEDESMLPGEEDIEEDDE